MKELALREIKNEQLKKLFNTFFDIIQMSLKIKDDNRSSFSKMLSDRDLRSLVENKEALQFKHFDSFIKNLQALGKNTDYSDTTEWKVLMFLSPSLKNSQHPTAVYQILEYLNQSEFLGENNFSVIKVASILYSLAQPEPLDAAKILTFLSFFDLLNEESLGKIRSHRELDIKSFTHVIEELSLSGGTDHLLTQDNLDKLLQNPDLNLKMLSQFVKAEDKSKVLTQEKFDLAINLKNLLTLENIGKLEKTEFDTKKLAGVISLLDQANILTQDNFDSLINLSKTDFEKIVPVLDKMYEKHILNQDNFFNFLNTFLNVSIYDAKRGQVDGSSFEQASSSTSLAERLCSALVDFLSRVGKYFQEFFDDILNYFNEKTEKHETLSISKPTEIPNVTGNHNSFFANSSSSQSENIDTKELSSNLINTR